MDVMNIKNVNCNDYDDDFVEQLNATWLDKNLEDELDFQQLKKSKREFNSKIKHKLKRPVK